MNLKENLTAFAASPGYESLHTSARRMNHLLIKQGRTDKQLESGRFLEARFIRELK